MKCFVVLTIVCFALVAADGDWKPPDRETDFETKLKCRQYVNTLFRGKGYSEDALQQESNLCYVKKVGVFTEENGFNIDRVLKGFQATHLPINMEKLRELTTKCSDLTEKKTPAAVWVNSWMECMMGGKIEELWKEGSKI